jgi:hypothetical protein
MSDVRFQGESAVEYFKQLVHDALANQRLAARELTTYYVVQLLAGFLQRPAAESDEPLAFQLARAFERGGAERRTSLKHIGDVSLFISGFFADSFSRKPVDVDYYIAIGGVAYGALSRRDTDALSPVFSDLADNFVGFVDVLAEVSERSSCSSNVDLLRLYDRWLKTGSVRSGHLLVERGVVPNLAFQRLKVQ